MVQDIGSDGNEDVGEREDLPEWMEHRFQPNFTTARIEDAGLPTTQLVGIQSFMVVARRKCGIVTEFARRHKALGTSAGVCAHYQRLLREVSNEDSKNGMAPVPYPIATHHGDSCFTRRRDRSQDSAHAKVKNVGKGALSSSLIGHTLEFGDWEVRN